VQLVVYSQRDTDGDKVLQVDPLVGRFLGQAGFAVAVCPGYQNLFRTWTSGRGVSLKDIVATKRLLIARLHVVALDHRTPRLPCTSLISLHHQYVRIENAPIKSLTSVPLCRCTEISSGNSHDWRGDL
jgi:hypothetical protein